MVTSLGKCNTKRSQNIYNWYTIKSSSLCTKHKTQRKKCNSNLDIEINEVFGSKNCVLIFLKQSLFLLSYRVFILFYCVS